MDLLQIYQDFLVILSSCSRPLAEERHELLHRDDGGVEPGRAGSMPSRKKARALSGLWALSPHEQSCDVVCFVAASRT